MTIKMYKVHPKKTYYYEGENCDLYDTSIPRKEDANGTS